MGVQTKVWSVTRNGPPQHLKAVAVQQSSCNLNRAQPQDSSIDMLNITGKYELLCLRTGTSTAVVVMGCFGLDIESKDQETAHR